MSKLIKILLTLVVLTVVVILACSCGGCSSGQASGPGGTAQDFQLQSLEGQTVSLGALKGKPVLLNFWATWCGPCRLEMPFLQEVSEDPELLERGLVILAVNLGESASVVREFMDNYALSFTVLLDTQQKVGMLYNISGIPTTYFIDKDGKIRDVKIGAFISEAEIIRRLSDSIIQGD